MTTVNAQPQDINLPSTPIKSQEQWRQYVIDNWDVLKRKSDTLNFKLPYYELIFIALAPVLPSDKKQLKSLSTLLSSIPFCEQISKRFQTIYDHEDFSISPKLLIEQHLSMNALSNLEHVGLDWIIATTGALSGVNKKNNSNKDFLSSLSKDVEQFDITSPVRVQARMLSAGQNLIIAGRDAQIITKIQEAGYTASLKTYLSKVRTEWNIPATNIHPRADAHTSFDLHALFTPPDVWDDTTHYSKAESTKLIARRFKAIDKDLNDARRPVLETIAENPYIVITGGAGTGKSSLCHFIVTALSFACDPKAAKKAKIDGIHLLSPGWIHGALLPIYVSLRDFANDNVSFPNNQTDAKAESLLSYIKSRSGSFGKHLESFLTETDVDTNGILLVLDGLDEVYDESSRILLRYIIENWADRFTNCRIILTSRTYAYRQDARWRLSNRFKSVELAPFTWRQIRFYVSCWYDNAAKTRPSAFGGKTVAIKQSKIMANDLIKSMVENKSIWPLARQPLMLALLTLIHEDYKHLPTKRADLYEQTVDLLDRWNIPSPADKLHEKLSTINLERMRAALKHIAYDLQSQQKTFEKYPATIKRPQLLDKLMDQQIHGDGLGAKIEDVLEYLSTRNSIIVSDIPEHFRFPHLSIQEYLAACALIEYYDECKMPDDVKPKFIEGWSFPENIVALLHDEPYRWRQVAMFAGSIIAADKGQDLRWNLIDELLPTTLNRQVSEPELHCIVVASEIWAESYLKPRKRLHGITQQHLKKCLETIQDDERLDAPERIKTIEILAQLEINTNL